MDILGEHPGEVIYICWDCQQVCVEIEWDWEEVRTAMIALPKENRLSATS